MDFAMEFYADGRGRVVFAGYSVFHTGGSGMYAGNDLLSDEKILQKLSAYVPQEGIYQAADSFGRRIVSFVRWLLSWILWEWI